MVPLWNIGYKNKTTVKEDCICGFSTTVLVGIDRAPIDSNVFITLKGFYPV